MKIAATKMSERGQFSCLENGTANFLKNCLLLKIVGGRTPQENKTFTRLVSSSRCTPSPPTTSRLQWARAEANAAFGGSTWVAKWVVLGGRGEGEQNESTLSRSVSLMSTAVMSTVMSRYSGFPGLKSSGSRTKPSQNVHSALPAPVRVHGEPQTCSEATGDIWGAHSIPCCVRPCSRTARAAESCARHVPLRSAAQRGGVDSPSPPLDFGAARTC